MGPFRYPRLPKMTISRVINKQMSSRNRKSHYRHQVVEPSLMGPTRLKRLNSSWKTGVAWNAWKPFRKQGKAASVKFPRPRGERSFHLMDVSSVIARAATLSTYWSKRDKKWKRSWRKMAIASTLGNARGFSIQTMIRMKLTMRDLWALELVLRINSMMNGIKLSGSLTSWYRV